MSENQAIPLPDPLVGALVGSRYRVVRELGRGGMAVVYLGEHEELGRRVAIKVIRPELQLTEHGVDRFLQEARTASHFSHPALVDVFDLGRLADGRPFMVMPFLKGCDLLDLLHREGPQSPARVAELLTLPATGLDAMHARQLVHRDIKPENLFLEERDTGPTVRIMDFGLAAMRGKGSRMTKHGMVIGTPHYLSPEVASGTKADVAADIYALATVAYELIAGVVPFDHPEPVRILARKMVEDAPLVSESARRKLPAAVDEVFIRALARRPDDRHQSCTELIDALRAASLRAGETKGPGAAMPAATRGASAATPTKLGTEGDDAGTLAESAPAAGAASLPDEPRAAKPARATDGSGERAGTHEVPLVFSEPPPPMPVAASSAVAVPATSTSEGAIRPEGAEALALTAKTAGGAAGASAAPTSDEDDSSATRDAHISTEVTRLPTKRLRWAIPIGLAIAAVGVLWVLGADGGAGARSARTEAGSEAARGPDDTSVAGDDELPAVAGAAPQGRTEEDRTAAAVPNATEAGEAGEAGEAAERDVAEATAGTRSGVARAGRGASDRIDRARAAEPAESASSMTAAESGSTRAAADDEQGAARPVTDVQRATELTNEGNQLALRGLLPAAIERYRDATLAAPRHAAAWRGLGIVNERMNRAAEARRAFERYLRIAPNAPDADRIRQRLAALQ